MQEVTPNKIFGSVSNFMEKFIMQGYVTKNAMQCYATENLVREDFTLHCIGQVQKDVQTV